MADNYLEKKMEEHRSGVRHTTRGLSPSGLKPGFAPIETYVRTAFVDCGDGTCEETFAMVGALGKAGIKVLMSCTDMKRGREAAQNSGARHYPYDGEKALSMIEGNEKTDLHASFADNTATLRFTDGENRILYSARSPENLSELGAVTVFLCLAKASMLRGLSFSIKEGSTEIAR